MNTLEFLNKHLNKTPEQIREYLFKNAKIKSNIEKNGTRMILYADKFKSDFNNPLTKECNGLILEFKNNKWDVLVVPPQCFNMNKLALKQLDLYYKANYYNCFKAYDGTSINLYYYNDTWRISSIRGYDVTDLVFVNGQTYKEVLDSLLDKYEHFSYSILDINKCYSLCFRYNQYHLFKEDKINDENNSYVIFLQSVDIKNMNNGKDNLSYNTNIGLPKQEYIDHNPISINQLYDKMNYSITLYKNNIINYGYILRSKNKNMNNEYKNVFIESKLMSLIRNAIYNYKNNNIVDDNYSLELVVKLNTFLNHKSFNLYSEIFNEFTNDYNLYKKYIGKLIPMYLVQNEDILSTSNKNITKPITNKIDISIEHPNEFYILLKNLFKEFYTYNNNNLLTLPYEEKLDIISNFINSSKFLEHYYNYFKLF